ncbi:MAG: DUF3616 domain-containing protein [Vicinamibacteria bacterium]
MRATRVVTAAGALALAAVLSASAAGLGPVQTLPGGPFEASGAVEAPGGGVLFVDDGRPDAVMWMRLDGDTAGAPVAVPLGASVADPEGITTDGTHVYVVGSQSRGKPGGAGLVRFRFDGARRQAEGAESVADLGSLLSPHVPGLAASGRKRSPLNIEGLAWDAKHERLLLGLRGPLEGGRALLVPVRMRDAKGAFTAANLEVGTPIRLDLDGSGVRGIEADGNAFWILAGGVGNAGTSRLVRWDGTGSAVTTAATFPDGLKPEGVVRTTVDGKARTLVLCDTSRYMLMD